MIALTVVSTTGVLAAPKAAPTIGNIIPMPASVTSTGDTFTLPCTADIYVNPGSAEVTAIGQYLADKLNPATGYGLTVIPTCCPPPEGTSTRRSEPIRHRARRATC